MASGRHLRVKVARIVQVMRNEPDLETHALCERFGISDSFVNSLRKRYRIPAPKRIGMYF